MNRLVASAVAGAAALMLAACGSGGSVHATSPASSPVAAAEPGVSTYLCTGSTEDDLLQWRDNDGYLSGTYESAKLSGQAPSEQVNSDSTSLSGTLDGTAITLNIGLSQPLYGSLSGSQLSLNVPQSDGTIRAATCNQASLSDWNSAVASLDSQAGSDNQAANQAAAQQQHDQQVSKAQQSLANDVSSLESDSSSLNKDSSLAGDIKTMNTDYGTEQSDYRTEQSDSCDSMSTDANTVGTDANTVGTDLNTLQTDVTTLQQGGIQSVKNDLSSIQSDLSTLQNLGVTPGTDSSAAVAAGNKALSNAASAISWAQGQGNMINGQAQQLATMAQNYSSSHCG
jgi:hypothetical protein